jgi:FlaA1/EpsC-like NDP-sugar epimerase
MIRLSNLVPGKDIQIKEIGLRPGEKLFEELLMKTEQLDKTENDMIFIERDTPYTRQEVNEKLRILMEAVNASTRIHEAIAKVVPTFQTPEQANQKAGSCAEMKMADQVM